MSTTQTRPTLGMAAYFAVIFALATYFTFASVQGDYGLFRRVQIDAEATQLRSQRDQLQREVAGMRNKTRRLSDDYLDLDLLDQQARDVLGLLRPDEIVIR
jgi:cell division protein FtsB